MWPKSTLASQTEPWGELYCDWGLEVGGWGLGGILGENIFALNHFLSCLKQFLPGWINPSIFEFLFLKSFLR